MQKDSHPVLYYLEGILLLLGKDAINDSGVLERVAVIYKKILDQGIIMNNLKSKQYYRSDVIAQSIRIGSLLYLHGNLSEIDYETVEQNLSYLIENFVCEGYVSFFRKDEINNYLNAWCAMFTFQAIDLFIGSKEKMLLECKPKLVYQSIY